MAPKISHNLLTDLRVPFKSYNNPVSTNLLFEDGANVITTIPGWLEPRPGFSAIAIPAPMGGFPGTIKRLFMWHRATGDVTSYFCMVCSCDNSQSYVYKFKFGTDVAAVLIRTCSTSATPFDFVSSNQTCFFGKDDVAGEMWKYNGTTISKWGITAPSVAPTIGLVAGTGNLTSGIYLRYTYGNSSTGHQSSVSGLSACTGVGTSKDVQFGVTASADAQVDQIHVYASTDGGSTNPIQMQEIPSSPYANTTTNHTFTPDDLALLDSFGPALRSCDPPLPMRGFISFANRIAGFSGNTFYYSAFEEIGQSGVPEEAWPSGIDGNSRPYPEAIYGLARTSTGAAIFCAREINAVDGDSLDTFRWSNVSMLQGAKYPTNVIAVGNTVLWLDTAKQIWASSLGEMAADIRPTLSSLVPSQTQFAAHKSGTFNWFVIMDGASGRLIPAQMDNQHWMVPWPLAGVSAIASGETADGTVDLLAAVNGVIYKAVAGTYNDAGAAYQSWLKWNLFKIAPDAEPDYYGVVDYIALETDGILPSDVRQLNDDDPSSIPITSPAWVSLKANQQDSTRRSSQGTAVIRKEYTSQPVTSNAQRVSVYIEWPTIDQAFHLYSLDIKSHINT